MCYKNYVVFSGQNYSIRHKTRARTEVQKATRMGILVRPIRCENCHKKCAVIAHHEDYAYPLYVIWLCRSCHYKRHWVEAFRLECL